MNNYIQEIIAKIKQAKKYKHLSEEVIKQKIEEFVKRNPKYNEFKEEYILKQIKAALHKAHGSFQVKEAKKRENLLKQLRQEPDNPEIIQDILKTNKSTKERLDIYRDLYEKIFSITGKPNSILDLGCGLNPVSFAFMNLKKETRYYCYDINESDKEFLNNLFKIENIQGKSGVLDLANIENVNSLPSSDVCFCFKLLDVLEKKGHKYSEEIIKIISEKCSYIVVSFATKTITGKPMNFPYRGWIERMLERLGFKFKKISFTNEIFYVIFR